MITKRLHLGFPVEARSFLENLCFFDNDKMLAI